MENNMQPQTPAEGISLTRDFNDSKFYRVDCSCGNNDDQINFEVEADMDSGAICVVTWTTQKTNWWNEVVKPRYNIDNEYLMGLNWFFSGLINGLATRLRLTKNIWWDGYVKYESATYMSKQQALNYAKTLEQAIADVEDNRTVQQEQRNLRNEINELKKEIKELRWAATHQD